MVKKNSFGCTFCLFCFVVIIILLILWKKCCDDKKELRKKTGFCDIPSDKEDCMKICTECTRGGPINCDPDSPSAVRVTKCTSLCDSCFD